MEFTVKPVGVVRSELKTPSLRAGKKGLEAAKDVRRGLEEARRIRTLVSELVIKPELEGILDGLEEFSHALVLYWPHLLPPEGRKLIKVHPMGNDDLPLVGVFSTCSPGRPNPILVTAASIIGREGNVLKVQGLEALDGSPIIDIKPYTRSYLYRENLVLSDWMLKIEQSMADEG